MITGRCVRITGIGGYLPERVLTNHELESMLDTTDTWIVDRTGIRQRHIIDKGQHTSDLAREAGQAALIDAGITIHDVDAIVVATTTPDMVFPSTASIVQQKLGGKGFPAWDIQAVCAGFVYGLAQLHAMIAAGMFQRVLFIAADSISRIVDWQDRGTCILFGDGAGAVVLEAGEGAGGIVGSVLHADGSYRPLLMAANPATLASPYKDKPELHVDSAGAAAVEMQGNEVFRTAVKQLGGIVDEILEKYSFGHDDVDWLIPHQANIRIIQATARKLNMDMDRVVLTVDRHANTSAASVPLALNHLYQEGKLKDGQLLLLEAFGAGFVWGANLLFWGKY